MHDPFQTYSSLGSYYGIPAGYGTPGAIGSPSLQSPALSLAGLNPIAGILGGHMGQPYTGFPAMAPFTPGLQNPLVAALSNPYIAAALQNQLNPVLALAQQVLTQQALAQQLAPANSPFQQYQQPQPFGQINSAFGQPLGQIGSPFNQGFGQGFSPFGQTGYPLAPQSWVGQQGGGQGPQQLHPLLSQLTGRPGTGISPFGW